MGVGVKSKTLRGLDAEGLRQSLVEKDVTPENFPELSSFWKILDEYVDHGYGASGDIKIPKLNRVLRYKLCVRETSESSAMLEYRKQ